MTGHRVIVGETPADNPDYAAKAFCDDCQWSGDRWHHADEFPAGDWESDPSAADDAAFDAATDEGREHTERTASPPIPTVTYASLVAAGAIAGCPHATPDIGAYCPVCDNPDA